jgi:hypothetical protein
MSDIMKHRTGIPSVGKRFAEQRQRAGQGRGNSGGGHSTKTRPQGEFDRFYPREEPCWINISPYSTYTYEVYDKEVREVVEVTTTWYEWKKHYVPRNRGKIDKYGKRKQMDFNCSAGSRKDRPCWGCAVRDNHFERMRAIEESKGYRPDEKPPVGWSSQFSLAITVMETIYAIPLRDKDGRARKSRAGDSLYRYMPAPFIEPEDGEKLGETYFGHRMHWTMGSEHLDMLLGFDEEMKNYCGNCADHMVATHTICPSCETTYALKEPLTGVALLKGRAKPRSCTACGEKQPHVMKYECPGCGEPKEGSLTGFDIRIYKEPLGENKSVLKVAAVRVPGSADAKVNARIQELIEHPLDLQSIFAPASLDNQKYILGDELTKGLTPAPKRKDTDEAETEGYVADDHEEGEGISY